ncbi:sushi domain-containing protein 1 isoform X11 [Brienomyrus brachyistius]|uniref:sushi domain-containing protein 1 isoform X11 n=1 Tax=Brienomyrus brachyistius TaxID=42636 RepID=UPI0020B2606F|nr:sushi domain-containing protein 1 isoform X11 [Brienomyrus brachyistius]
MRKDRMFWSTAALSMVFLIHFGFTISTVGMQGVDVCATCHINATCEEKADGHKVCNCMYGFVGNGRTHCQDKDECQIGANKICGNHTACHNTYGSFYCTCLTGYHPSNNMATFIPNDGTFCDDIDECRVQGICGEGAHCSNVQGSFNCRCQVGYRLENGQEPFRPSHDKSHCTAVDCGPPRSAGRAILLSFTGTSYLSQAVFGCSEGFRWKSGNTAAVCGAERVWEGPSLVCEEIKCGDPPVLPHATHQWNGSTAVGTKVEYLCNEGLRPVGGEHTSICGGRGTWTNVTLQCKEVDCGEPPSFPHAAMLWNQSSRVGAQVHYQCRVGFYNAGKGNVSLCTADGYWDPVDILCQEVDCGEPPSFPHAAMLWNQSSRVGAQVHYQCCAGFYNAGKGNVSLCTTDGYWDPVDILCQEVDCGEPPSFPHAAMLWNQSSRVGAQVHYQCCAGFYNAGKGNVSLCTADGYWDPVNILCQEVDCGEPPSLPHAAMLWNQSSRVGAQVHYQCRAGFYNAGKGNVSLCTAGGYWDPVDILCQEVDCGEPPSFPHAAMLWNQSSRVGAQVHYQCRVGFYNAGKGNVSLCTADGYWDPVDILCQALCGPAPQLLHAVVEWQNGTVAVHRCQDGYRSRTGSNISVCDHAQTWHAATLICREVKPPISKVEVFNESCLRWKAEMNGGNQEHYTVQFVGSRAYQKAFQDKQMLVFKSGANRPELCMNLLPGTNYSINITAQTANFSLTVSANTSIQAPPVPHVTFRDVEGSCPTLGLHRTIHPQDAISVYQVFVLLLEGKVVFDCSSPRTPHFYGCREPCQEYITAEVQLAATGRKLFFTVGDQQWYGGYYNAPLENGKDYYIILRAVSQWAGVRKQYCVIWAKVKGASYIIESVTLLTGGSIGLVAFIVLLGYSYTWYCKKQ